MSRYIPPEEMNEAQIREQLDAEYQHWDDLKKNGAALDVRRWYGFEERAAVAAGSPGQVHGSDREVPRPSERQVGWPDF